MSRAGTIRYTIAAAAFCAVLSAGAAHADSAVFVDVLKPNGHARSKAAKLTDGRACGVSADHTIRVIMPVFEACMRRKGWAFDHYRPDPSSRPRHGTNLNYTDTRGDENAHPRGNAALQADTRACGAGHGDEESPRFKQCMSAHGWQFIYAQRAPRSHLAAPAEGSWSMPWGSSSSSSSNDDQARRDDEARRNDEARAATHGSRFADGDIYHAPAGRWHREGVTSTDRRAELVKFCGR